MDRRQDAAPLLACLAVALFVLAALAMNVARVGSAIAREVQRAQTEYVHRMGTGLRARNNAALLGQCVRRELMKSARDGLAQPGRWAFRARLKAMPACTQALPALPPQKPPVITSPRARPIVASLHGG